MIYAKTQFGSWCAAVGIDEGNMPDSEAVKAHMARVYGSAACDHHAMVVNGTVELVTCPNCSD
jgi:hypothetical protein